MKLKLISIIPAALILLSSQTFAGGHGKHAMKKMDADGDGLISLDEFNPPGHRMMEGADVNSDGLVTIEELQAFHSERSEERRAKHLAKMEEHFLAMDANQDGGVTAQEAKAAIFARIDQDEDGFLSRKELKQARKHMRGRHKDRVGGRHGDEE